MSASKASGAIVLAHLAVLGANIIYGINFTVAKGIMPQYILPSGFIFVRVSIALFMFFLLWLGFKREKIERKDLLRFIGCGLTGVAINQLLFFKGLNLTSPINASIIMTSNPILVLVAASIILKEMITWRKLIGIALGLSGAIFLIVMRPGASNMATSSSWLGDVFVFINAASYATYLVIVAPLMKKYHPFTVSMFVFGFGFLFVIPFGYQEFSAIVWSEMPTAILWGVAFVVVGTTFLTYLFNVFALRNLPPSVVSSYIYAQPLFASLVSLYLGVDAMNATKILAAVLIFTGVYLVSVTPKRLSTNKME